MNPSVGRPEIIGHGGAGHFHPGNSRAALETALALGADRVEFDVQRAGDGALLLVHDDKLHMPGGGYRSIRGMTTAEIAERFPGVLSFDDAIELIDDRARILVDIKAPGYEQELIAAIRRHNLRAESAVSSTYALSLRTIHRACPGIRIGLSTGHLAGGADRHHLRTAIAKGLNTVLPTALLAAARAIRATDVMVQFRVANPRLVRLMHEHGIRVTCWTVDRPWQIARLIALGVDGITSNRPDLVRNLVERRYGPVGMHDESTSVPPSGSA